MFFLLACWAKQDVSSFSFVLNVLLVKLMAALCRVASFASIGLQVLRRVASPDAVDAYERCWVVFCLAVLDFLFRPSLLVALPPLVANTALCMRLHALHAA